MLQIKKQIIENTDKGKVILIEGETEPDCELLINSVKVKIQKNGRFSLRAKVPPDAQVVNLSSVDKNGRRTDFQIQIVRKMGIDLEILGGLTMLAGGGLDASKIGVIFGGNFGYKLIDKVVAGFFANTRTIGCKTTDWDPEGSHFNTQIYMAGFRLKCVLNPYSNLSYYGGIELGGGYWKSLYDGDVYEWAINPYGGGILGIKRDISHKFSLFFECGAGYLRNKSKPNMGTQDINYIIPKGYLGILLLP
ncbi:MAG: hypothetical protein N3A65_05115 [candidate division WOR-3 bacterium]|nr:hypothetical protein [candidate division WOR-3 bacterium]